MDITKLLLFLPEWGTIMDIFVKDKLLWHGDKVREWQQGGNPFPITMELDLCGACNSHCPRCAGGERRGKLEKDKVVQVLQELAAEGTRAVTYTGGGEPSLHEDLAELLLRTKTLGMDCALITNGLALTPEQIESTVTNCTWARISLDAGTASSYKYTHGGTPEEFEQVIENTALLALARKRLETDCTIGVGYLIDDRTIPDMEASAKICKDVGADYIQFRPFYLGSWFNGPDAIDFDAYNYAYWKCHKMETDSFKVLHSGPKFDKIEHNQLTRGYSKCYGQQFCGVITATGDVVLCCLFRGQERYVLGNITDSTFKEIWNGSRRRQVLDKLNVHRDCPPLCRCDPQNDLLSKMITEPTHINFL